MAVCTECKKRVPTRKPVVRRVRTIIARKNVLATADINLIDAIVSSKNTGTWLDLSEKIKRLYMSTGMSERKIATALEISKSEIHRLLLLSELPSDMKFAASVYNTEKYVLLEWQEVKNPAGRESLRRRIVTGEIRLRKQLHKAMGII